MNRPAPLPRALDVNQPDGPEFYKGTALEVEAIRDAISELTNTVDGFVALHKTKSPVALKVACDDIAKTANQINILASHLSKVTALYINRKPHA
jgi:hypothetical protein